MCVCVCGGGWAVRAGLLTSMVSANVDPFKDTDVAFIKQGSTQSLVASRANVWRVPGLCVDVYVIVETTGNRRARRLSNFDRSWQ